MYNRKRYSSSIKQGKSAENKFIDLAKKRNFIIKKSSVHEDRTQHWDYEITRSFPNYLYQKKFDVKAIKKTNSEFTDKFIWIELQNVGGGKGWLYGEADGIAFEMDEGFIMVTLKNLQDKVATLIDINKPSVTTVKNKKPYIIYDRKPWDNNDRIVLITKEDLLSIPHKLWSL